MYLVEAYAQGKCVVPMGSRFYCGFLEPVPECFLFVGQVSIEGEELLVGIAHSDLSKEEPKLHVIDPRCWVLWENGTVQRDDLRAVQGELLRRLPDLHTDTMWPELQPFAVRFWAANIPLHGFFRQGDYIRVSGSSPMLFCGIFKGSWLVATYDGATTPFDVVGEFHLNGTDWCLMSSEPFSAQPVLMDEDLKIAQTLQNLLLCNPPIGSFVSTYGSQKSLYLGRDGKYNLSHEVAVSEDPHDSETAPANPTFDRRVEADGQVYRVLRIPSEIMTLRDLPTQETTELARKIASLEGPA